MLPSTPPWYTCQWTGGINGKMHISGLDWAAIAFLWDGTISLVKYQKDKAKLPKHRSIQAPFSSTLILTRNQAHSEYRGKLSCVKSNSACQFHWSYAIEPLQIPAFLEMSSREMKLGSMVTILRPGFRVLNGNHPVLLVRKKRFNQDPTSRRWWLCFLTLMELWELSSYPGTLQWTLNIIRAY